MKNKRTFLGLGLLALVLILGVGYAVVSSVDLTISGNVSANSNLKVSFEGTTSVSDEDRVSASATEGELTATINVQKLSSVGDTVTATYTIKNEEKDVKAKIEKSLITVLASDEVTNLSEYFEVTTSVDTNALEIEAEGTDTVTVTVKLLKTPLTEATSTAKVTVKLLASPVVA